MNKNLQNYFAKYRSVLQKKSLISTEEIRSLINLCKDNPEININNVRNIRRYVIVTAISSIILSGVFLLSALFRLQNESAPVTTTHKKITQNTVGQESVIPDDHNQKISDNLSLPSSIEQNSDAVGRNNKTSGKNGASTQKQCFSFTKDDNGISLDMGSSTESIHYNSSPSRQPSESLQAQKPQTNTEENINGITTLELTPEELKALNVFYHDSSVELTFETISQKAFLTPAEKSKYDSLGYDVGADEFLVRTHMRTGLMSRQIVEYRTLPDAHKQVSEYSRLCPVFFNLNIGSVKAVLLHNIPILKFLNEEMASVIYNWIEHRPADHQTNEYLTSNVRFDSCYRYYINKKLVPVRIPVVYDIGSSGHAPGEVKLWFYPNEEFLSALPARFSEPLRRELAVLSDIEKNNSPVEIACKALEEQETFFDICRMKSGAIETLTLAPNPAESSTTARYSLNQARKLKITLHDIDGIFIRVIKDECDQAPGSYDINIDLGGVGPGFYLVAIQSDKGEQVVQRLIVN